MGNGTSRIACLDACVLPQNWKNIFKAFLNCANIPLDDGPELSYNSFCNKKIASEAPGGASAVNIEAFVACLTALAYEIEEEGAAIGLPVDPPEFGADATYYDLCVWVCSNIQPTP